MKRILFFTVVFFVSVSPAFSQLKLNVKASASNLLRYGSGKETTLSSTTGKDYFEELGDVRLFVNDFIIGLRYEYDDPIEYGTGTKGISRRYVEFNKDNFLVRVGNFYELFGNGLILNAFENRGQGFNTQFDGLKLNYKNNWKKIKLDASFVGGGMVYDDFLVPGRQENYSLRGGNFSFSPINLFTIGGSYLFAKGNIPSGNISTDITAELFEGNLGFNYKSISFQGSYANKKTITVPNSLYPQSKTPRGDGGYTSLTFTSGGLGVTADYKNYRFDLVTPAERSSTNPTKILPFQNPPTGVKEHSSTLLSRYPHTPDFNDEVGFQIDAFYTPIEDLTFNLNASLTSRHYDYIDVDTTTLTRYQRVERDYAFLPSPEKKYSPYWELFLEAEYYYKQHWYFKAAVGRQYSVLYTIIDPANSDIVHTFTVPILVKYDFAKIYSVELHAEQQFVYNSVRVDKKNFYNEYLSLSVSRSPNLIVNGTIEFSNDEEDPSGKKVWGTGEITYKIGSANSITIAYGNERGGLKCSSGICRYFNPFNGFRLTVINNFN